MPHWKATKFALTDDSGNVDADYVTVEWRGPDAWAVIDRGCCLNDQGKWEYESSPGNRSEGFIKRTRFPLKVALEMANKLLEVDGKHELLGGCDGNNRKETP